MDMHAHAGHESHEGHAYPHAHQDPTPPTDTVPLRDPVCGMTVTEQAPHRLEHDGRPYYFCSGKCLMKFSAEPTKYVQAAEPVVVPAPAAAETATGTTYTCPMHPEIRQDHPGNCPEVRHDIGARAARAGGNRESGTRGLPAALLVDAAIHGSRHRHGDAGPPAGVVRDGQAELDRAGADAADCPVGRLAVLRARRAIDREPQPEHVDADRPGHRRGLPLQRGGDGDTAGVPGLVRVDGKGGGVLRGRGSDHLADAARSDPRTEGALADLGSHPLAAGPGAQDRAPHRRRRPRRGRAADACACRRPVAGAAGRKSACRRRGGRGQQRRR